MTPKPPGRLAIFLPGLYDGGAERIMLNLAEGLAGRGYAVDLVLAEAVGPYLSEVPPSVRLVVLNTRQLRSSRTLAALPGLVRYLRRERPEVLLSNLSYANIVALWAGRLSGVPVRVVVTEHNTLSVAGQELSPWYRWLLLQLVKTFYPWANDVVVVSRGAADDFVQATGLPSERIRVIYNPIITPELRGKAEAALEHPWFAAGQPPVVLAVGRLSGQKDFGTLLHAFARVRETCTARLLILGEGEDRPMLETLIERLSLQGNVEMPGFVANPYAYMAHARLFVLSSRWEGLPTVLVEALFCGLPVVATDCPSGPREILQGGQFGRLVPVGDVGALAQAIEAGLAGQVQAPPVDSWMPFEQATVVDQYLNMLVGS